ncbi:MAG: RNA-dependent DNA polymerase [Acidobacteria bacterium]|nr:RNA-dependent DNA polymerase [Acidobacteriota bacterium]
MIPLWPKLTAAQNLFNAAHRAAAGKHARSDVAAFLANLEPELFRLRRELMGAIYRPGRYRTFPIADPKPRLISAAPFRDRVVHHALTNIVEPLFERRFVPYSFACRKGFGAHKALTLARDACAKYPCVLKLDIRKYFQSIDHLLLKDRLARVIDCPDTLHLIDLILASSIQSDDRVEYFPGDGLFTPIERPRGLPLGNQTSQFFANVYLDPMDQMIVRNLRPGAYARYVGDFLLFANSKEQLHDMHGQIREFLYRYRLSLHPGKSRVYWCRDGFPFLGFRLFPTHARLVRPNVVRFRRRLRQLQADYHASLIDKETVNQSVLAWIGHAMHGDTWRLREQIFDALALSRRGVQIARPWPRALPKTRTCFMFDAGCPASGPRPGNGKARSRQFLDGTLAAGCYTRSISPGQPEPQIVVLFVQLIVVAIRRARVPSIVVESTAPPHVTTAFRLLVYHPKNFPRGGNAPSAPPTGFFGSS